MNLIKKFEIFLENLKNEDNVSCIDVIKKGFNEIFEALSTDDANKPIGGVGANASVTTIFPNENNEYFKQTLSDAFLKKVMKAQAGNRPWIYPKSGRSGSHTDPMKSGHGTYPNANAPGDWAGDSGGYNLGGPLT